MPIYEYECSTCEHRFEELVLSPNDRQAPKCPSCGKKQTRRMLSVFAAHDATAPTFGAESAPGCMRCGDPHGPCGL